MPPRIADSLAITLDTITNTATKVHITSVHVLHVAHNIFGAAIGLRSALRIWCQDPQVADAIFATSVLVIITMLLPWVRMLFYVIGFPITIGVWLMIMVIRTTPKWTVILVGTACITGTALYYSTL